jgi:electron transport complex protein RnfG
MKNSLMKPTVVLFLVTLFSAAIIGLTYTVTKEPIETRRADTEMAAILYLLPETYRVESVFVNLADSSLTRLTTGYNRDGLVIGYVFSALPTGYGGRIDMMVAFCLRGEILGVRIINHSETPGLGANITQDWFLGAFEGRTQNITAKDVPVIASSTVSVNAVLRGVNDAVDYLRGGGFVHD